MKGIVAMETSGDRIGSVLVVDDDTEILDMLEYILTSEGYRCEKARNGDVAFELIKKNPIDILLTDIVMPGIGGFELTERAKRLRPSIIVILMTGFIDDFSYDRAIEAGASDFIKKPFTGIEIMVRIRHVKLQEKLRVMAITDELTGLLNRRGFFNLAEQQMKLARRRKKGVFIIYVDMDNLKGINDGFGHQAGDVALLEVANVLKASFRDSDIIARIGGDEFVVIPVDSKDDGMEIITTRLQNNLEDHNERNPRPYKLSASCGVAYCDPRSNSSIDELLSHADHLMFEQKRLKREKGQSGLRD